MDLTPRQRQIYDYLRRCVEERGFPPTVAEIAAHFGMRSPNAAAQHLRLLRRKGAIEVAPRRARGIRLLRENPAPRGLPIVGRVAAGSPILAEENVEGQLPLDPRLFRPRADYLLRVAGDSMTGAGILDGDLVAVRRTPEVANRAIAVARVGRGAAAEVTVKRFVRKGSLARLLPENPRHAPIEVDLRSEEIRIEGEVVGVVRLVLGERRRS